MDETAKANRETTQAKYISESGNLSEAKERLKADMADINSIFIRPEEYRASKFLEFAYDNQRLALEEKDPIKS